MPHKFIFIDEVDFNLAKKVVTIIGRRAIVEVLGRRREKAHICDEQLQITEASSITMQTLAPTLLPISSLS